MNRLILRCGHRCGGTAAFRVFSAASPEYRWGVALCRRCTLDMLMDARPFFMNVLILDPTAYHHAYTVELSGRRP